MGFPNGPSGMFIAAVIGGVSFCTLLFIFILIYLKRKKKLANYQRLQQELLAFKARKQSRTKSCFDVLTTVQEHGKAPRFSIPNTKPKTRPKETCELKCSLQYNFHTEILKIQVVCVVNLPRVLGLQSGVFVKVRLHSSDEDFCKELGKTKTHLSSQNPIFEEFFETKLRSTELKEMVLNMDLYSCDRFNQSHFIGDVDIKIDDVHLSPLLEAVELWRPVQPKSDQKANHSKGQLMISLRYQKNTGRINVVVMKAQNLVTRKRLSRTDPYVVIKLLLNNEVVEKKRTQPKKSLNPVWNEPFVFDWKNGSSSGYKFVFVIKSSDLVLPDATLGVVEICQEDSEHWAEMMERRNYARAMCHEVQ